MRSILIRSVLFRGVAVLSVLGAQSVWASSSSSEPSWLKKLPGYSLPKGFQFNDDYVFLTPDQKQMMLAAARKEASRKVAEQGIDKETIVETNETPELRNFIQKLTEARTAQDLEGLIDRAQNEADADTTPDDLKFYMAQLAPMKASRGWLFKIRPFLNDRRLAGFHAHPFRNALVTAGKLLASFQNVIFPKTQWDAGYDYLVSPNPADVSVIKEPIELQNYAAKEVLPRLVKTAERLKKLEETTSLIIWDNKVVFGKFRSDEIGRFRIVKPGNIHALVSAYNLAISNLEFSYCYHLDGIVEVLDDLNDKLVVGAVSPEADGASARDRVAILTSKTASDFLTVKTDAEIQAGVQHTRKEILTQSQNHLLEAIDEAQIANDSLVKSSERNFDFIAPAAFRPYQTILNRSFDTAHAMWSKEKFPITSDVTGDPLIASLTNLFGDNPPPDLKKFAPKTTDSSAELGPEQVGFVKNAQGNDEKRTYHVRNFKAGSATSWDLPKFEPFFPGITNQGVPRAAQILSQTWGAANLFLLVQ